MKPKAATWNPKCANGAPQCSQHGPESWFEQLKLSAEDPAVWKLLEKCLEICLKFVWNGFFEGYTGRFAPHWKFVNSLRINFQTILKQIAPPGSPCNPPLSPFDFFISLALLPVQGFSSKIVFKSCFNYFSQLFCSKILFKDYVQRFFFQIFVQWHFRICCSKSFIK